MAKMRAAIFAALFLLGWSHQVSAQDVTLTSRDGGVEISGNLLSFDGEFYLVDTIYGQLTIDGSGVICTGPGCPDLEAFIARVVFSGAPSIGQGLLPALVQAFASSQSLVVERLDTSPGQQIFVFTNPEQQRVVGEFTVEMTNSEEGFADLLANEADIVMSTREIEQDELARALDAGLGDLQARGRARVIALDALVPVVAPGNPVQTISLPNLARVASGQVDNWLILGGPDAPIAVHVFGQKIGLGRVTDELVMEPARLEFQDDTITHSTVGSLVKAVADDPFALGISIKSELGNTSELSLAGACGFAMRATRRAVKMEDYPLTSPMFLYLPARRLPKLAREFLSFLRGPTAQLVIRRAGFVDQSPEEIRIDEQGDRFVNAIAQAGQEIDLGQLQEMVAVLAPLKRLTTTFRFEAGSARLDAQSRSNISFLARSIELGDYDEKRLVFVGFSDGDGPASTNRTIALRRAEAVRDAVLAAAEAARTDRISVEAYAFGEAMPMACDDTDWGRRVNRRVEVWVR